MSLKVSKGFKVECLHLRDVKHRNSFWKWFQIVTRNNLSNLLPPKLGPNHSSETHQIEQQTNFVTPNCLWTSSPSKNFKVISLNHTTSLQRTERLDRRTEQRPPKEVARANRWIQHKANKIVPGWRIYYFIHLLKTTPRSRRTSSLRGHTNSQQNHRNFGPTHFWGALHKKNSESRFPKFLQIHSFKSWLASHSSQTLKNRKQGRETTRPWKHPVCDPLNRASWHGKALQR